MFATAPPQTKADNRTNTTNSQRNAKGVSIQAKLTVGKPNDKYEQEADHIADRVMRMPDRGTVLRKKAGYKEEEKIQQKPLAAWITPYIQRQAKGEPEVSPALESRLNSSKSGGRSLPGKTRSFMESRIGADFSNVKVHTDSNAVQMSKELGAQAFTHGNHIYFNQGKYNPESASGKHLLAHEMVHTLHQNGNANGQNVQSKWIQREPEIEEQETSMLTYTVVPGDTLSEIAEKYGTTTDALKIANHIEDENFIRVGQTLQIPDTELERRENGYTQERDEITIVIDVERLAEFGTDIDQQVQEIMDSVEAWWIDNRDTMGTRATGLLKGIGGVLEMVVGAAGVVAPEPVSSVVGGLAVVHGADVAASGFMQMLTGENESSFTSQGLQVLGMSEQHADLVDVGISIVLTAGAGALANSSRAGLTGGRVVATGQRHHLLSNRIMRTLNNHRSLRGVFNRSNPRYIYNALDDAAHRGYQKWHRQYDEIVVNWLQNHPSATPAQFNRYLHNLHQQPWLRSRIPNVNLLNR